MGWFNKNKNEDELEIPELPRLPDISEVALPEIPPGLKNPENRSPPKLPYLPPAGSFERFKSEQRQIISPEFAPSNFPMKTEPFENHGMKEIGSGIIPRTMEIEPEFKSAKKIEPLYIRLDKFETTVVSFKEIKNKILEIEELLAKTKEIKIKEEKELEEWEREIEGMKSRIDFIDKNVFNKIE